MRDAVTTLLDTLGLLLIAAAAALGLWPVIGAASLALAGVVILVGSAVSRSRDEVVDDAGRDVA